MSESLCCPPGSWEGPLNPSGPLPPKGTSFTLEGTDLKVYYTPPPPNAASKLGLVVFHDVWGHLPRLLSICDSLATRGGFHVIAPDIFRGTTKDDVDDMLKWFQQHPYDDQHVAKDIALCLDYLTKAHAVTSFGAMGYCWGGWAIAKSAAAGVPWKVGVSPHPSFGVEKRAFGGDENEMIQKVNMPFLLLPAGNDPDTVKPGHPMVQHLEEKGGKSIVFDDMVHGWTTRSDLTDPKIKQAVEKALSLSLDFLKTHLQ